MAASGRAAPDEQGTAPVAVSGPPTPPTPPGPPKPRGLSRSEQLNKLYALPAPLRTFPLPAFVPHNPLSLFHLLYVWVSQAIKPESSHTLPPFRGWFSPETRSVHVTDPRSIRGLWEQGFYGKGTLSRSEPTWLNQAQLRSDMGKKDTRIEEIRSQRRAERQATKWERARKEREAIELQLQEEAEAVGQTADPMVDDEAIEKESSVGALSLDPMVPVIRATSHAPIVEGKPMELDPAGSITVDAVERILESVSPSSQASLNFAAPVGPLELLALPDSQTELDGLHTAKVQCLVEDSEETAIQRSYAAPVGPLELLALPNSNKSSLPIPALPLGAHDVTPDLISTPQSNSCADVEPKAAILPGSSIESDERSLPKALKLNHPTLEEANSVGGSETNDESVHSEQTTGTHDTVSTQPNGTPISSRSKRSKSVRFSPAVEQNTFIQTEPPSPERAVAASPPASKATFATSPPVIRNQEHMQLTLEESFFLSYALGALTVLDPATHLPISPTDLFHLSRRTSTFPPLIDAARLQPDDPFMINYVVYHHFRSLGWVVRPGIKFSVDYMLYARGPVFTHAEFCVLILPAYSDPYWRSTSALVRYAQAREQRTWAWMSCINRVVTQVKKTLILTYVDVPVPVSAEREREMGIAGVLGRYRIREVVVKRWSANRMRD